MNLRGKLDQWVNLITPGLVDRIVSRAIRSGSIILGRGPIPAIGWRCAGWPPIP